MSLREAKNCIKNLEGNKEFDWKFYKTYIEDIERSLFFKRDLIYENLIKQSDITTFDNSIFDCYRNLIKQEKMPLVEAKNKQYFEVNINRYFHIYFYFDYREIISLSLKYIFNKLGKSKKNFYNTFEIICRIKST